MHPEEQKILGLKGSYFVVAIHQLKKPLRSHTTAGELYSNTVVYCLTLSRLVDVQTKQHQLSVP